MKTSIKYVTLSTIDPETGGPKSLQIRNANGDLRSRLLISRLDSEVVKYFPPELYDEVLADYMELLDERDSLMMALESCFTSAYTNIFTTGLLSLQKYYNPDEDNIINSFAEFKYDAHVGNHFEEAHRLGDVFHRSYDCERPNLLYQLLEERHRLKAEINRLRIAIANLNDFSERKY